MNACFDYHESCLWGDFCGDFSFEGDVCISFSLYSIKACTFSFSPFSLLSYCCFSVISTLLLQYFFSFLLSASSIFLSASVVSVLKMFLIWFMVRWQKVPSLMISCSLMSCCRVNICRQRLEQLSVSTELSQVSLVICSSGREVVIRCKALAWKTQGSVARGVDSKTADELREWCALLQYFSIGSGQGTLTFLVTLETDISLASTRLSLSPSLASSFCLSTFSLVTGSCR